MTADTKQLDLEIRQWHAQTVSMILGDNRYGELFRKGIRNVTKVLGNCLHIQVTEGKEVHLRKALFPIVEQAAKLSEEINRQIALFQLQHVDPACPYDPRYMEDRSGLLDDEEKEWHGKARGIIVQKVLFPVVLRYGFDEAGEFLDVPVVVRKGTVVVTRSEASGIDFERTGREVLTMENTI